MVFLTPIICAAANDNADANGERIAFASTFGGNDYSEPNFTGGIYVAVGDLDTPRTLVAVSRIALPNSPLEFSFVDANDPDAASKTRALFDAADRLRRGIVISVPKGAWNVTGRIPAVKFFVLAGENQGTFLQVTLKDVLVTSYQSGGHTGRSVPTDQFSLNFERIRF